MVITVVCLPNVHCSLPMSTGLCCTNVHRSSSVVVFHCCSSLLSAVSLSSCCQHPSKRLCLSFANACFLTHPCFANASIRQFLLLAQPCFCKYPVSNKSRFLPMPDYCWYPFLPILDSIWIPNVANTLFFGKRCWFSRINKVIYVNQYGGTIKIE